MNWPTDAIKTFTLEQWPILALVGAVLVWLVCEVIAGYKKKPPEPPHQSVKKVLAGSRIIKG